MGAYQSWLAAERGLEFGGYDALWQWSVDELESFWAAVWSFYGVQSATPVASPLGERRMPGASGSRERR